MEQSTAYADAALVPTPGGPGGDEIHLVEHVDPAPEHRRRNVGVIVLIGVVMLLLGGAGGVLIGYALGEDSAQQSLSQALVDVSELTVDKVALEESLVTVKGEAGACYAAAALGYEALENRTEALALENAVPLDASDAVWDAMWDKVYVLDDEFGRLAGRVEVADAACIAANEAANQSVGAVDLLG